MPPGTDPHPYPLPGGEGVERSVVKEVISFPGVYAGRRHPAARDTNMAEFFISYTQSDSQWAHWIALDLRDMGHIAHVHEWEVGPGEDIVAWMARHHDAADHVLCVVSDAYLQAPYSTLERNAAVWAAAKDRPGFVIFVVVQPCTLPTLTDHLRRCELYGLPEDAARAR